jgi:hypothetical protein
MRKSLILRELAESIFRVGWGGVLTGVPVWENDGVTWSPAMGDFLGARAITAGKCYHNCN